MIPLMKNAFTNETECRKVLADFILSNNQLSMGSKVKEFEQQFAKWQGRKYAVLVNSGSSANLVLLQALKNSGIKKKVGFSGLTWATNVMPLIQLGYEPFPLDCNVNTLNVNSDILLEQLKKEKINILFLTNALGFCDDIDIIAEICKQNNIILLEDNCESLGSKYKETKLGNFGLASTFSFFVAHHMSTIEGGMICTDDEKLYNDLLMVRANGWDRSLDFRSKLQLRKEHNLEDEFYALYTFYDLAYNVRPTEITGVLGLEQLKYIDKSIVAREQNYFYISESMHGAKFIPIFNSNLMFVSNFAFPVICRDSNYRDECIKKFSTAGIEIRPLIAGNITLQPFYKKYHPSVELPNANHIHKAGFYFGNYPELTNDDLETIISCLR